MGRGVQKSPSQGENLPRDDFVFRPGAGLAVTLHQHFWFTISLSYYLAAINRDDQPRGDGFQVGVGVLGSL